MHFLVIKCAPFLFKIGYNINIEDYFFFEMGEIN